jgi:hypothetical protein
MNPKMNRNKPLTAKRLVCELQANARVPGFLVRLCRWEKMRRHNGLFTLQHRHD